MNNYSERAMRSKSNKVVKKVKEEPTKPVKKKKVNKQHLLFYKLVSFILIILTVFTFGVVIYNDFFDWKYLTMLGIVSFIIVFIITRILNKKRLRSWIKNIFTVLAFILQIFEILVLVYGMTFLNFLSTITDTGFRVESFGLYVLDDSIYKEPEDIIDGYVYYLNTNETKTTNDALDKLSKKFKYTDISSDSLKELLDKLTNKDADAIFMNKSYYDIALEEYPEIAQKLKLIYTVEVTDTVQTLKTDKDITKETFTVYISGIDTSGNVASSARSDVNILLTINPNTNQILMVSTPRDYYITLASKGKKDKLTHAGIYGVEESVKTLNNLYDVNIDYYVRINFTSFMKIVNSLGGIEVNVPKSFCEQNSKRSFEEEDLICLNKGKQHLNGEQALAFARHRKTLAEGDKTRGSNQMLVLEAIIKKTLSLDSITKINSIIKSLEGRVITNMSTEDMYKFAKKEMKKNPNFVYSNISVNGTSATRPCFAVGGANASVMLQDEDAVEHVKKMIDEVYEGKEVTPYEPTTTKKQ